MGFTERLAPDSELELPEPAELTPAERKKLEKKLERVTEKCRVASKKVSDMLMDSPRSQRRWKAERAWDELAKERMRLIALLGN